MNQKISQISDLISAFECAILDLSAKLHDDKTLTADDIENAHFVIGMARTNSVTLQTAFELGASYYAANKEKVDRLIAEATAFAESFKEEGYGLCKTC
ncbi:MAG: hypothetical protein Q8K61_10575 [Gallionella sp.]|nr:hypothetical protein [Gallionella sp.]